MATQGMNLASSGLTFTTETTERVIITDTGTLGLGVLTPTAMLHVVPTGSTNTIKLEKLSGSSSNTNFLVADGDGYVETRNDIVTGTVNAITGITYSDDWGLTSTGTGTYSGSPELPFITGGTYSGGTITLNINGGLESVIDITGLDGTDTFVTGVTLSTGTLTLTRNDAANINTTGFSITIVDGAATSVDKNLGSTITFSGGTGITTRYYGTDLMEIDLDNTAVTAASYGAADTVGTFTVDAQGRLTGATDVTIDITASQVSDFSATTMTDIFTENNFVDTNGASGIDFTVTAGTSVSAVLQNSSISTSGTTGTGTISLGGQLGFASSGGTLTVVDKGSGLFDLEVDSSAGIGNIYTINGTLTGARTVTQGGNTLAFSGGDFTVDGTTFVVDDSRDAVSIGAAAPATDAVLDLTSTTKGFLFPRMSQAQRVAMATVTTGIMVYQIDGREGVYIYKSFGWVQVI